MLQTAPHTEYTAVVCATWVFVYLDRNIWLSNSYGGDFLCLFIYFWTFIGYVTISIAVVESERHLC